MDITVNIGERPNFEQVRPGNVYQVRGGRGARDGHMHVVLAITESRMVVCLTINALGDPVSATSYGIHYFEEKVPIAFADGVEDINLNVRSL